MAQQEPDPPVNVVTIEDLAARIDVLGQQMNWMCENLQSLFGFVNQMSNNGGGIRGLMHALKQTPPDLNSVPIETQSNVKADA